MCPYFLHKQFLTIVYHTLQISKLASATPGQAYLTLGVAQYVLLHHQAGHLLSSFCALVSVWVSCLPVLGIQVHHKCAILCEAFQTFCFPAVRINILFSSTSIAFHLVLNVIPKIMHFIDLLVSDSQAFLRDRSGGLFSWVLVPSIELWLHLMNVP